MENFYDNIPHLKSPIDFFDKVILKPDSFHQKKCVISDLSKSNNVSTWESRTLLLTPDAFTCSVINPVKEEQFEVSPCLQQNLVLPIHLNEDNNNGDVPISNNTAKRKLFEAGSPSIAVVSPLSSSFQSHKIHSPNARDDDIVQNDSSIVQETVLVQNETTANVSKNILLRNLHDSCDVSVIGVFWDIENCPVPKNISATYLVQAIRERYFRGFVEGEFLCVCNTLRINPKILDELNEAQINVVHVGKSVKNAADDKLLQGMRRFADTFGAGSRIVLISGDADFATEIYDLRYRKRLYIILLHNALAKDFFKLGAHEVSVFQDLLKDIPENPELKLIKIDSIDQYLTLTHLPKYKDEDYFRLRISKLISRYGGKIVSLNRICVELLFHTPELALCAQKFLDGIYLFGTQLKCYVGTYEQSQGDPSHPWREAVKQGFIDLVNQHSYSYFAAEEPKPLPCSFHPPEFESYPDTSLKVPSFFEGNTTDEFPYTGGGNCPNVNLVSKNSEYSVDIDKNHPRSSFEEDYTVSATGQDLPVISDEELSIIEDYVRSDQVNPITEDSVNSSILQNSSLKEDSSLEHKTDMYLSTNFTGVPSHSPTSNRETSPHPLYLRSSEQVNNTYSNRNNFEGSNYVSSNGSYLNGQQYSYHRNQNSQMWNENSDHKRRWQHHSSPTSINNYHKSPPVHEMAKLNLDGESQVIEEENELMVSLVDRTFVTDLLTKTRQLLWDEHSCSLPLANFKQLYTTRYGEAPNIEILRKDLDEFIKIEGPDTTGIIKLVPTQIFARDLLVILHDAGGRMLLMNLETAYLDRFGIACRPATCGFTNLISLMQNLKEFITIKGKGTKRIIVLNEEFENVVPKGAPAPLSSGCVRYNTSVEREKCCGYPFGSFSRVNSPTKLDHKSIFKEHQSNPVVMLTPPPPNRYQTPSSLIYPGSPVTTNGSVMWSQLWSPQYPVISSMSPHYMIAPPNPSELPNPGPLTQNDLSTGESFQSSSSLSNTMNSLRNSEASIGPIKGFSKSRIAAQFDSNKH